MCIFTLWSGSNKSLQGPLSEYIWLYTLKNRLFEELACESNRMRVCSKGEICSFSSELWPYSKTSTACSPLFDFCSFCFSTPRSAPARFRARFPLYSISSEFAPNRGYTDSFIGRPVFIQRYPMEGRPW